MVLVIVVRVVVWCMEGTPMLVWLEKTWVLLGGKVACQWLLEYLVVFCELVSELS